ncbi:MAG: nitroreductase family protein [Bacteroidetes bacterium]|nr:nitroreductase family protein [Bacteroidota bacterium]
MSFKKQLNWRYATKRMNGQKVDDVKFQNILDAIQLAPSSMGLQPFSVIVVKDLETRKKMAPVCFNQPQILEADAILVFAAWKNITEENVNTYIDNIINTRNAPSESLEGFKQNILGLVNGKTQEELVIWSSKQAYIALGFGLFAAAIEEVDTTPMEGFNPDALDEILQLNQKGLKSLALLAVGHRDAENDYLNGAAKVRRPASDFFIHI